jgi:putative sigma-54 modulation protein
LRGEKPIAFRDSIPFASALESRVSDGRGGGSLGKEPRSISLVETAAVQTTISARHGHLSAATQERIADKVEVVRKFFDRVTAISVTVDMGHRERTILELRVRAEHHDEFVAIAEADTVFAALDGAVEKMENQLRRFKERLKEHRAVGHKHLEPPLPPVAS